jgi:hypothetical protein
MYRDWFICLFPTKLLFHNIDFRRIRLIAGFLISQNPQNLRANKNSELLLGCLREQNPFLRVD